MALKIKLQGGWCEEHRVKIVTSLRGHDTNAQYFVYLCSVSFILDIEFVTLYMQLDSSLA